METPDKPSPCMMANFPWEMIFQHLVYPLQRTAVCRGPAGGPSGCRASGAGRRVGRVAPSRGADTRPGGRGRRGARSGGRQ